MAADCMLLECILYVGVLDVASRERRSLRRGSGLLLTRTIRARSQRLQEMMDVPVHNLEWILQKQRQKTSKRACITRHDVRGVVHHDSIRTYPRALDIQTRSERCQRACWHRSICYLSLSVSKCALCNVYHPASK